MAPKVSVVTPTYNRKHLIGDAIESVLLQRFSDYEMIVVDDGSNDGTEEFVQSRYGGKIQYVKQKNQGISAARNKGISLAKGQYIAFLDSDDKWYPEKLEKQIAYMESHPEIGLLCSRFRAYEIGHEDKLRFGPDDFSSNFQDLLNSQNYIPTSTVVIRKECFDAVGVFDSDINCYEDFDLWLRIAHIYKFACLNEELAVYREHPQNIGKDMSNTHRGLWKVYSKMLSRYGSSISKTSLIRKKAAVYEYLVGAEAFKKGDFKTAQTHISHALKTDLFLGTYFSKNPLMGPVSILKTYMVLFLSFMKQTGRS